MRAAFSDPALRRAWDAYLDNISVLPAQIVQGKPYAATQLVYTQIKRTFPTLGRDCAFKEYLVFEPDGTILSLTHGCISFTGVLSVVFRVVGARVVFLGSPLPPRLKRGRLEC